MAQRRHEPARIDLQQRFWLDVRVNLDVLVGDALELERDPDTVDEGATASGTGETTRQSPRHFNKGQPQPAP